MSIFPRAVEEIEMITSKTTFNNDQPQVKNHEVKFGVLGFNRLLKHVTSTWHKFLKALENFSIQT